MPSLADKLKTFFPSRFRGRGRSILRRGQVELDGGSGPPWYAEVQGTRLYEICIDPEEEDTGSCTCPAFERDGPCKHMWATVLVLDESGEAGEAGFVADVFVPTHREERDGAIITTGYMQKAPPVRRRNPTAPSADQRLDSIEALGSAEASSRPWVERLSRVEYLVGLHDSAATGALVVRPVLRRRLKNGSWGVPKPLSGTGEDGVLPVVDRLALAALRGGGTVDAHVVYGLSLGREYEIPPILLPTVLPILMATGRVFATPVLMRSRHHQGNVQPLTWEKGAPFRFRTRLRKSKGKVALEGWLERDGEVVEATNVVGILEERYVLTEDRLVEVDLGEESSAAVDVLTHGALEVSSSRQARLKKIVDGGGEEVLQAPAPRPCLDLDEPLEGGSRRALLVGRVLFLYGDCEAFAADLQPVFVDGKLCRRNLEAEGLALSRFEELGGTIYDDDGRPGFGLRRSELERVVLGLIGNGWEVRAARRPVRAASTPSVSVRSGVDWFELSGGVPFGDQVLSLPELLGALQTGDRHVRLGDGSLGILPSSWLNGWEQFLGLGTREGDTLRFAANQGWILDALLAESDVKAQVDRAFVRARKQLASFAGIEPRCEPKGFGTVLRPYQRAGLGWLLFLERLGLGGCLADDMGLGKTVQVLALLELRRRKRPQPPPSLVVAPRSLLFHWEREAASFAPKLKLLCFTGAKRFAEHEEAVEDGFRGYHLVLTTYGVLRRDASRLGHVRWDYAILDEAQAIKNERSQASKAARLVRATNRLALTGTPVENHVGELWALFEFLNPGMLGRSSVFQKLVAQGRGREDGAFGDSLQKALRPFLLRRTKAEVLPELPPKSEQTLLCDLPSAQRGSYRQLASFYRQAVLGGLPLEKARFQVLEALLRLRQAACHPGLLDARRRDEDCAKFQVLWPMLLELQEENHKALVFSQFTSLLALLRGRLDEAGIVYEYLDGRTRKRREKVDRFQSDPDCKLFLISLKAGGHGLNLTAADYVFLLDPWWNPAVETQAIDRTHRIGQQRPVMAYRLLCKDTVEERVAELQQRKRKLAEAVLGGERSLLQELTRQDLERLLA